VPRDVDVDILEIVDARAAHANPFVGHTDENASPTRNHNRNTMSSFHEFERTGWERAAEFYGDAFGALTSQTAGPMLDAVGATGGTRLLDVACGPGDGCRPSPFAKATPKRCPSTPQPSTPSS
jgi:hypothetical protein